MVSVPAPYVEVTVADPVIDIDEFIEIVMLVVTNAPDASVTVTVSVEIPDVAFVAIVTTPPEVIESPVREEIDQVSVPVPPVAVKAVEVALLPTVAVRVACPPSITIGGLTVRDADVVVVDVLKPFESVSVTVSLYK